MPVSTRFRCVGPVRVPGQQAEWVLGASVKLAAAVIGQHDAVDAAVIHHGGRRRVFDPLTTSFCPATATQLALATVEGEAGVIDG